MDGQRFLLVPERRWFVARERTERSLGNERVYKRKKRIKNLEVLVPNKSNKTLEQIMGICTVRILEAYIVLDA